jgi:hypothetical protein
MTGMLINRGRFFKITFYVCISHQNFGCNLMGSNSNYLCQSSLYKFPGFGSGCNLIPIGPSMLIAGPVPPICDWYDSKMFFRAFISISTGSKASISSKLSPADTALLTGF